MFACSHTLRPIYHDPDDNIIDFGINRTRMMGPCRRSGMTDFVEGREADAIGREPLRRARAAGVSVQHLARLLERIEQRLARA